MLIDKKTLEDISVLLSDTSEGWFQYSDNIKNLYGDKDYGTLIDEFDEFLKDLQSNKKPHWSTIFYSSLMIIFYEDIDNIAEYVKNKSSFNLLVRGLEIFLKANSSTLKYEVDFNYDYYKNKMRLMNMISGSIYDIEYKLRGIIYIFEMIYNCDKNIFFDLLKKDRQNSIYLYFILSGDIDFEYEDLEGFIKSDDEIKSIGGFYYITSRLRYLTMDYKYSDDVNKQDSIEHEIDKIEKVMDNLDEEKRIYLIVNYIFEETKFPEFFIKELKCSDIKIINKYLKEQDLNSLVDLVKMYVFIKEIKSIEIECLFREYFIPWVREKGNEYLWNDYREGIKNIINNLSSGVKEKIHCDLIDIKDNLCTTTFDRQVRYVSYLEDISKDKIILDIEKMI